MSGVFRHLKVVDFTWVLAGPLITRYLAAFGAQVVRVESAHRPDAVRTSNPFKDRKVGIDRSGYFAFLNAKGLFSRRFWQTSLAIAMDRK